MLVFECNKITNYDNGISGFDSPIFSSCQLPVATRLMTAFCIPAGKYIVYFSFTVNASTCSAAHRVAFQDQLYAV